MRISDWSSDVCSSDLGLRLGEVVLGVLDEQRVDVDDVTLDQHVVRALPQFHQGAGDDVDEAPGEIAEGRAVALAGKLPRDASRHLSDSPKTHPGGVERGHDRPPQIKDVELNFASRALEIGK